METRRLDNWQIDIFDDGDDKPFPIRAVATDIMDGHTEAANGRDLEAALLDLRRKIHVDHKDLLMLYDID